MKILINADSGIGKDTVKNIILDSSSMKYGVSTTTREKRVGEKEGLQYYFKTIKQYNDLIKNSKLAETDYFNGNHYGYEKQVVKDNNLFIVAGNGMLDLIKYIEQELKEEVVVFGLTLNRKERERRMLNRGDTIESIESRLSKENKERFEKDLEHADYIYENKDSHETAFKILNKLVELEFFN